MEANSSSTVTSYTQRLLNSFNNSSASEIQMTSNAPTLATSGIAPARTDTSTGSAAGDTRAQDNSKPILISVAAAILTGFTLLTNPPKLAHNVLLYNFYSLALFLSLVLSIGSLVPILSTTPNQLGGTAWVRRKALQIASVSLVASVMLRIFLQLPGHIKWYHVLVPVLVLGGISMYLLIGWIKTTDSAQISNSAIASSDQTDSAPISTPAIASSDEAV